MAYIESPLKYSQYVRLNPTPTFIHLAFIMHMIVILALSEL